jgi:hypothetical protein
VSNAPLKSTHLDFINSQDDFDGAIRAIETALPDAYWHLAKGKISANEALYAAVIFDGVTPIGDAESDLGPGDALRRALAAALSGTWVNPVDDDPSDQDIIRHIATVATRIGDRAGEPAMELAGQIISVLAANPEMTGDFMTHGAELFIDGRMNVEHGCLPYRAINGTIVSPALLRQKMGIAQ